MNSYIKILSGLCFLSLILIVGAHPNAQGKSREVELKKKGRVQAIYFVEENITIVYAFNLSIREDVYESLRINVDFRVRGRKVIAPEMVRIIFDSKSRKRKFSNGHPLITYFGGNQVELFSTSYIIRGEYEDGIFESVDFMIPYAAFKELIKEKNIKMLLSGEEFELPGWIRGELKTIVGMVEN